MSKRARHLSAIGVILLLALTLAAEPICKSDPDDCARKIREHLSGQRSLGVTMTATRWGPVIISVLPGSPAARAGLRVDDRIVAIEGTDCTKLDLQEVKQLLLETGEDGSWISLIVARPGNFHRARARLETLSPHQIDLIIQRHLRTAHAD